MMHNNAILATVLASILTALTQARAQDALGSGNALDRNLGVGTGGVNSPIPAPNYRDRNLLITGDVIGGRGFRGSVGYTAESDFRGHLGSNDIFGFRAQSAFSSPQLFQNMQTYEQLRFGQDLGLIEYRRSGSGDITSINAQNPVPAIDPNVRMRIDRRLLDSSLALTQQHSIEPRIVGTTYSREGDLLFYNASSLRGITIEWPSQAAGMIGLSTFDAARVREDVTAGQEPPQLGAPYRTRFDSLRHDESVDKRSDDARVERDQSTEHAKILQRVAERYAGRKNIDLKASPELLQDLNKDYGQIRDELTGRARRTDEKADAQKTFRPDVKRPTSREDEPLDEPAGPLTPAPTMPTGPGDSSASPSSPQGPPGLPATIDPASKGASAADYGAILRHGQRVEHLASATRDRFNELLAAAEQRLREGDYLSAEQRFERALRFVPGHPLASAGVAHSQIGAGLYLSASLTLRNLFTTQPEMIDVRYAPHLLPNPQRVDAAVRRLNEHLQGESNDRPNYAFLLAYLGHQTDDRDLVTQGLEVIERLDPNNRLLPVLRDVWLAPAENTPEPTQTAEPRQPAGSEE